jgi:hypothetical protein
MAGRCQDQDCSGDGNRAWRIQGRYCLRNGSLGWLIEVLRQEGGWFWRGWPCVPVIGAGGPACSIAGDEVTAGPFTTSTQAYCDACERFMPERKIALGVPFSGFEGNSVQGA